MKRLYRAAHAGLCTFWLLAALMAAPLLAQAQDFGHHHPEGTPDHVHPLDMVLVVSPVAALATGPSTAWAVVTTVSVAVVNAPGQAPRAYQGLPRAPPAQTA